MEADYVITVINDAETPLAASAGSGQPYYPVMVMTVVVSALFIGILFYYMQCFRYRERYYRLCSAMGRTGAAGWRLGKLKQSVVEIENEHASIILKEVWQKNGLKEQGVFIKEEGGRKNTLCEQNHSN